ncbi:MAG: ABC transporter ATP-binding protein, partial [Candidatus Omnitrophica bacterium]|nr:ABC transporter ATP-binding protein [Candidatus Omnitrophota bacterium]
MVILAVENLSKKFGNKRVLEKVNLKLEEGEIVSLLGPSGCGKTTFLRIVAGLERPDEGEVLLENKPVTEILAKEPKTVAIFQDYPPYRREKSGKRLPYWFMYQRWYFQIIKERIDIVSNLMKIEKKILLGLRPATQSRGEQQRLDLSRYLLTIRKVA